MTTYTATAPLSRRDAGLAPSVSEPDSAALEIEAAFNPEVQRLMEQPSEKAPKPCALRGPRCDASVSHLASINNVDQ